MIYEDKVSNNAAFMNPYQAFAAIRTRNDVPMEVVPLDDLLFEVVSAFGPQLIRVLSLPLYAVRWPDSHASGGQIAISAVPVLVRDGYGNLHSRFHEENTVGLTPEARHALDCFREVVKSTEAVLEIRSHPGDLVLYSNTRAMHRRRAYTPMFNGMDRYYVRTYLAPRRFLSDGRVRG
jgi:hypothetical protein